MAPHNIQDDDVFEKKDYPFEWIDISEEEKVKRRELYASDSGPWCVNPNASMVDLIMSSPGGVLMPKSFRTIAEQVYNFEVRPDDVFVVTYPKSGTTWTQEMVWQILHDFDLEGGQEPLAIRSPFLEMESLSNTSSKKRSAKAATVSMDIARNMKSPRVIKTHLPIEMLPPNLLDIAKVVFVARNPKDCCVSFYHHERLVPTQGFSGTFDEYAEMFLNGQNPMGSYWYHLNSGWRMKDHPNLKFLWYEDMKTDLVPIIRDMCCFLEKSMDEETIIKLDSHLHIDNFRKNSSVNMESNFKGSSGKFIRKGTVGDWRNHFSADMLKKWNHWIEENTKGMNITLQS